MNAKTDKKTDNKKITGLNFDEGRKGFPVNGDKNRMIYFNPSDVNLYDRMLMAEAMIEEAFDSIPEAAKDEVNSGAVKTKVAVDAVNCAQEQIREAINYMLDSDCYDTIFGRMSPFTPVNGEFLINGVFGGLAQLIATETDKDMKNLNNKLKKYRTNK